jgi:putative transposase
MKRSKFTEHQITYALKQAELGTTVEEVCRKDGHIRRHVLQLEEEIRRSGAIRIAPTTSTRGREHQAQKAGRGPVPGQSHAAGRSRKKALKPSRKRTLIDELRDRYRASLTQTCALLKISRSLYAYRSIARDSSPLVMRIKEIAATRVHYGYRRVHVLLKREGWQDNIKRVYRLISKKACRCVLNTPSATSRPGCVNPSI